MGISIDTTTKDGIKTGDIVYLKKDLSKRFVTFIMSFGFILLSKDSKSININDSFLRKDFYTTAEFNKLRRKEKIEKLLASYK